MAQDAEVLYQEIQWLESHLEQFEKNIQIGFLEISAAGTRSKIHPFVKEPFCHLCSNHIDRHNKTDNQKDRNG